MQKLSRILVPVDFSAPARAALDHAIFLAWRFGAAIDVLTVWQAQRDTEETRLGAFARTKAGHDMADLLDEIEHKVRGPIRGRLMSGDPAQAILEAADEGYDLIVMGTHGRTGLSHLLLGSVAETVVRRSPCPVFTVRMSGDEAQAHGGVAT